VGGLYETTALVQRPGSTSELEAIFADARRRGVRLTLVGAGRSFGRHFFPPSGAEGLDTTSLPGRVMPLERTDAGLWVRVPGSHTFERLSRDVPNHVPPHPPTGDRATVAGALAACTHNTSAFFAGDVRAFRVMTPDGAVVECRADATGPGETLFRHVPGSFGALGVILDVELYLRRFDPDERLVITVLERCPADGHRALDRLDDLHERGEYPVGLGIFFLMRTGECVLLGDRVAKETPRPRRAALPLVDDHTERNIALQGLGNWAPAASQVLQAAALRKGRQFDASPYGFAYYQRSYDRAYETLAGTSWWARALRRIGVDPRLSVCHQSFVVPLAEARPFLDFYREALRATPALAARLELQDIFRLPPCPWPLHGAYGMEGGSYLFTTSFSVRREHESFADVRRFLELVSQQGFERFGVRVLLLKQAHCDVAVLRRMHASFLADLGRIRRELDCTRILTSQLLADLGGEGF
jgi:FAD/FMN-containing dehydrogenase